ncbi:MAG: amidohydrolase family protein [Elusimicrobia bacterium]|nr:amidohydrolase family protein [Elusimicrobiota bacterium]
MIIDTEVYLGHWPFRKLKYNTAKKMVGLMEKKNIDKAIVSSLHSVFYRNSHTGNIELLEEIAKYKNKLIPFACINPAYPGWEEDLEYCYKKLKVKGIRIHPYYHNYIPNDSNCVKLFRKAADYGLPVSVTISLEDQRQRHWLVKLPYIYDKEAIHTHIIELLRKSPETNVILMHNGYLGGHSGYDYKILLPVADKRKGKVLFGLINFPLTKDTVKEIGIERIVFSTQMPFRYPEFSLMMTKHLEISAKEKEKIYWKNILKIIR